MYNKTYFQIWKYLPSLRIDNSWQGISRTTLLSSAAFLCTVAYYTSNYRYIFSLSNEINYVVITSIIMKLLILNRFFHLYFLNMDISLNTYTLVIKFYTGVLNIPLRDRCLSYLGPSFYFMIKNG